MFNTNPMNESFKQPNHFSRTETNPKKPIFTDYNSQYRSLDSFKASDPSQKSIPLRIFDHSNPLRTSAFEESNIKLQNEKRIIYQNSENNPRSHRGLTINQPENYPNSDDAEIAEYNTINRIPVSPIGLKQMNSPLLNLQNEHKEPYPSFISAESSMITSMPNLLPARKTQTRIFDKKEPNQSFERNFKPLLSNLSFHAPRFPTVSLNNLEQKTLLSTPAKLKIEATEFKSDVLSTQVTNPKRLRHSNLSTLTESDTSSSNKNKQFASKFSLKYKDHRSSPEVDGRSTFHTNNNECSNKKLDFPDPDDELYRLKKPIRTETLEFEKVNLESRFSLTSEKFKDYFQEPKNWIKSLLTPNPRKGLKCDCDIGLAIDKTCSRALKWLLKKYKPSELPYLKETYEKIVLEQKIIEFEQIKQIDKDINRTFPKSQLFQHGSDGVQILKRVLNAIAKYDPSVGYVQGMNFIAGSLLFHAEEYIAFWVMVSLFEELEMRDIFLPKLPGLSKHCQITEILLFNYKPNIYSKLCEFQIRPELFLTEWVLTLFGNIAPITDMGEIYENLFRQRWVFFYKLVLAFVTHFEKEIEQESDMIGVLTILKSQNRIANKPENFKSSYRVDWRDLSKKANEIFIDPAFIDEMHLKFDIKNQWFRTTS